MNQKSLNSCVVEKENTHIVIKREDVLKYLSEPEQIALEVILNRIIDGRRNDGKKPVNHYYVVNKDEPYADIISGVILGGEYRKGNI